jgi:hypothetical protein
LIGSECHWPTLFLHGFFLGLSLVNTSVSTPKSIRVHRRGLASPGVLIVLSACIVATSASRATAVLLPAGTTIFAAPEAPVVGGTLVAGGVPVSVTSATFDGTLTSSVISGDGNNGALGGLTFVYTLTNDARSPGQMDRLTVNGFSGFITDSGYVLPGVAPGLNDRSVSGDVVGFTFIGPPIGTGVLLPGQSSAQLIVRTDAQNFTPTFASVIDGSVASVLSFAPLPQNVPEPSTLAIAATGLFGLAAWGWCQRGRRIHRLSLVNRSLDREHSESVSEGSAQMGNVGKQFFSTTITKGYRS